MKRTSRKSQQTANQVTEPFAEMEPPKATADCAPLGGDVVEQDALEHIRRDAYLKWEAAGQPAGDGISFWLAAEREFLERNKMPDPSGCADVVQEASEESFPASDPPAWGGSREKVAV
jgi:hypothetical protein